MKTFKAGSYYYIPSYKAIFKVFSLTHKTHGDGYLKIKYISGSIKYDWLGKDADLAIESLKLNKLTYAYYTGEKLDEVKTGTRSRRNTRNPRKTRHKVRSKA